MIVCHCHAVSDRTIVQLVRDGKTSLDAVSEATGATTCCGGCALAVEQIIEQARARGRVSLPVLVQAALTSG